MQRNNAMTNFIKNEIFILTISGAFGRNSVYKVGISEKTKSKFREKIKLLLIDLEEKYLKTVKESDHLAILDKLKENIEVQSREILRDDHITFGTTQKLLNLYLKYLWCLGLINEPPHCPIDRTILNKIKDYKTSWTKMEREGYCQAIEMIKLIKGTNSIAEWELKEFGRKN